MKRHTPRWDRTVHREFEAKNPGPPKKRSKREKACIIISDDGTGEDLQNMGDDWSIDLWDELVKDKPEHWDIRDALKHGKRQGQGDTSMNKNIATTGRESKRSEGRC